MNKSIKGAVVELKNALCVEGSLEVVLWSSILSRVRSDGQAMLILYRITDINLSIF